MFETFINNIKTYFKPIFGKVLSSIESTSFWALPIKLTISSLFGVLTGATFLGVLSKYMIYIYAALQGVRVPVEGIDLLGPAVSFYSFILSFLCIFIFIMIFSFLKFISYIVFKYFIKIKKTSFLENVIIFLQFVGTLSIILSFLFYIFPIVDEKYAFLVFALLIVFSLIFYLVAYNPGIIKTFTLFAVLTIISVTTLVTMRKDTVSDFLAFCKFGGEIPISIIFEKESEIFEDQIDGFLYLRTSSYYIVFPKNSQNIIEIPQNKVKAIVYQKLK